MKLYQKLLNIRAKISVAKTAKNDFNKFSYAPISEILSTINPLLDNEKVLITISNEYQKELSTPIILEKPQIENSKSNGKEKHIENYVIQKNWLRFVVDVYDCESEDKLQFKYDFAIDQTQNNDVQAIGSTMTYANRYIYGTLFGIPFDSDDPDAKVDNQTGEVKEYPNKGNGTAKTPPKNPEIEYMTLAQWKQISDCRKNLHISDEQMSKYLEIVGITNKLKTEEKEFDIIMTDLNSGNFYDVIGETDSIVDMTKQDVKYDEMKENMLINSSKKIENFKEVEHAQGFEL